jgi:hypothetical protein
MPANATIDRRVQGTAMPTIPLEPIDSVTVTALIDNVTGAPLEGHVSQPLRPVLTPAGSRLINADRAWGAAALGARDSEALKLT